MFELQSILRKYWGLLPESTLNIYHIFQGNVMPNRISCSLLGLLLTSLALPAAYGQVLEEIIVTAERRETNLQDTPTAITVMSAVQIEKAETRHLSDLINLAAGLSFEAINPDQSRIGIRGLMTTDDSAGTDQSTGVFIDGLYFGRTALLAQNLSDVERVEVLRGPQGTLWGHNVVGGSINIITHDPTDEFEMVGRFTAGNHGRLDFSGRVAGPITDNLLGQISVASENTDGYIRNINTGNKLEQKEVVSTRGKLIWTPVEDLELKLNAAYQGNNSYGHALTHVAHSESFLSPVVPLLTAQNALGEIDQHSDGEYDTDLWTLNFIAEWALGNGLTITNQTGYINYNANNPDNNFFTFPAAVGFIDRDVAIDDKTVSQELRIANDPSNRLIWQAGVFYYDNTSFRQEDWLRSSPSPGPPAFGFPTFACIALRNCAYDQSNVLQQRVETETWAIFGQATYALTDYMNVTVGGRYTNVEKTTFNDVQGDWSPIFLLEGPTESCLPRSPVFAPRSCGFTAQHTSEWDDFTPKFIVDFPFEDVGAFDAIMPYVTVSRGWKAGGYDPGTSASDAVIPFLPEEAWNYEAGIKTTFLNNRVNFNATYFHTDYDNLQIISVTASGPGIITENANSSIDGIELDMMARVTGWLDVSAAYTYYDSTYKDGSISSGTPIGGNRTVSTPKHTWQLGWNMGWELTNDTSLSLGGSYAYKDEVFFDPTNDTFIPLSEGQKYSKRSILNATASLTWKNWELTVWGRNLLDDIYLASSTGFAGFYTSHIGDGGRLPGWPANASVSGNLQEPLNYGVSIKYTH